MTEQIVEGVVSTGAGSQSRTVVHKGPLGAETSAVLPKPVNANWKTSGQGRLVKSVTERLNEAYRDDELEPEEREFLDLTREHFSRLDDE
jgi:hypothetical protein